MKVRTTFMLDETVAHKLRMDVKNMSEFVNSLLHRELFGRKKSMFGAFKDVSGKDKIEDDE